VGSRVIILLLDTAWYFFRLLPLLKSANIEFLLLPLKEYNRKGKITREKEGKITLCLSNPKYTRYWTIFALFSPNVSSGKLVNQRLWSDPSLKLLMKPVEQVSSVQTLNLTTDIANGHRTLLLLTQAVALLV